MESARGANGSTYKMAEWLAEPRLVFFYMMEPVVEGTTFCYPVVEGVTFCDLKCRSVDGLRNKVASQKIDLPAHSLLIPRARCMCSLRPSTCCQLSAFALLLLQA